MTTRFDFAVVGRGLWGSATAMYLARSGARVALIGPEEPADRQTAEGPFASHYDAGRITRSIATDVSWSRLSARSIENYAALERDSGITFYDNCGGAMASLDPAYANSFLDTAEREKLNISKLSGKALKTALPMFEFPEGVVCALDPTGGFVDPRKMRLAHETLAKAAGATVIEQPARALAEERADLADGSSITAGQIIVATGSYAALDGLLPVKPEMTVCARTVFFAEVKGPELERLRHMPSLIYQDAASDYYLYLLPPILYPDGRWLLKIGGESVDKTIQTAEEARTWMQGTGSPRVAAKLEAALRALMPDLKIESGAQDACILALTPTNQPYLQRLRPDLVIGTGCCGAGAKCADQIGRVLADIGLDRHSEAVDQFEAQLA